MEVQTHWAPPMNAFIDYLDSTLIRSVTLHQAMIQAMSQTTSQPLVPKLSNKCSINGLYYTLCLTTDDAFWRRLTLAACYQLVQSVLKIGSALAERVGHGEVGGCIPLGDGACRLLQLVVEKLWSVPGGPLVCFLAQTGVENAPFTL